MSECQADLEVAHRHMCFMVCYKGHRELIRYLLEQGAHVSQRSTKGTMALQGCPEIL